MKRQLSPAVGRLGVALAMLGVSLAWMAAIPPMTYMVRWIMVGFASFIYLLGGLLAAGALGYGRGSKLVYAMRMLRLALFGGIVVAVMQAQR